MDILQKVIKLYENRRLNNHCEIIGEGMFSQVFEITPTIVLKVITREDEAYTDYIKIAKVKNALNPFYPKIIHIYKNLIFLEKLECSKNALDIVCEIEKYLISDTITYIQDTYFREVLTDIYYLAYAKHYCPDIHTGNVMFRGKQLVITDPLCCGKRRA